VKKFDCINKFIFFKEKQQPAARNKKQKQQEQEMEVDEQEEGEDDGDGQEENEAVKDNEGEGQNDEVEGQNEGEGQDEEGEGQEEIEEGGEEANDYDIIMIDDEDAGIKLKPKQEVKQEREGSMEKTAETPLENADEDDDIIVIEVKLKQEIKQEGEGSMEKTTDETPQENEANPTEKTLKEMLHEADAKVYYKWMARFEPNQIEPKVMEMDNAELLKMVEMADQEVRQHPEKFILIYN
jgi:hypothetical protein